jgi:hypothetical protein
VGGAGAADRALGGDLGVEVRPEAWDEPQAAETIPTHISSTSTARVTADLAVSRVNNMERMASVLRGVPMPVVAPVSTRRYEAKVRGR